jgi:GT2 family glycosyltransferase
MVDYDEEMTLGNDVWLEGKEGYWSQSFFCLRREAIEEIGLFDENYGLGGQDDYDWHYRMNTLHKWLSPYTNKAAYQHKDSSTQILIDPEVKEKLYAKNTAYFKSKYGKTPSEMWEYLYPDMKNHSWKPFV